MTFRNVATAALVLALISIGIYWFVNRPTAEERALMDFFSEFKLGHYDEAEGFTVGDDFYAMAADTLVRDSDGTVYLISEYFPPNSKGILEFSIETYMRQHIAKWKYLSLDTERPEGNEHASVHFRIELGVRDFTAGEGFMGVVHEGRVEGFAHMELENGEWVIRKFEFSIFSDEGLALSTYLDRAI